MQDKTRKLFSFWNELKRRKVLRSLAIYAGTAFIILEASTIIFPRWGFPDWSIDLVLWLLILGALINVIIAWIYDITPGGMQRTKALDELPGEEKIPDSRVWKAATYISLVVIVGLIILNLIGGPKQLRAGDIQSLVILPFDNFTGDEGLDYFVSGMHASLIGDMGQLGGLQVKSRTSSNAFKEMDMTIPEIASELGVDAALETAVLCLGDTICIQLRLVRTTGDEKQLWVAEYREEKSQILNLYNRITKQIAKEVMVGLSTDEKRRLDKMRTVDKEAYDAYLSSYALWEDFSKESLDKAYEYLNLALKKDPEWAPLYAGMAQIWSIRTQMGLVEPVLGRQMVHENIDRAKELDPDFADSHFYNGTRSTWGDWNWEQGEKSFLKALAINPNDVMSRIYYAHLLMILQRPDEALIQGELAVELDPLNPVILGLYSVILRSTGQFHKALEHAEKALSIHPEHDFSISEMKSALNSLGEYDKAFEYRKKVLSKFFEEELIQSFDQLYKEQGYIATDKEILRQFELLAQHRYVSPYVLARRHYMRGEYSKTLDDLERGYALHEPNIPYLATGDNGFVELYDSTRFIAIVEKMNLPLPMND
jgi:TolB-like protein/Tfp pilus assembly protein PilF